ncbi:hypothetical protein CSQ88_12505 [Iodobacter sp. BJB302]|nr:hypothetical protein CSQ88_12505 [Iodobacter sp. BJB302]
MMIVLKPAQAGFFLPQIIREHCKPGYAGMLCKKHKIYYVYLPALSLLNSLLLSSIMSDK